jgi:hypothetical protein
MEKVKMELEVPKSVHDLAKALVDLVDLVDEQLENGLQIVEDGSAIVFSKELVTVIKNLASYKAVIADAKEEPDAALGAMLLAVVELIKKIKN